MKTSKRKIPKIAKLIGPGFITGASDDDPSGIATYSQAGAQFGFGMLWTLFFSIPLMSAIQEISARVGRVTGHGIAGNLKAFYPAWVLYGMTFLLFSANTINLAADIQAMGAALRVLIGGPSFVYILFFALVSLLLQIFVPYKRYVRYLRWLTLVLFAYALTAFISPIPWKEVAVATVKPFLTLDRRSLMMLIAILGTTLSPYLLFWQASEEVEEMKTVHKEAPLKAESQKALPEFKRIRWDTWAGMTFSNAIAFFIILTTALLHRTNQTEITTATEAAKALEPLAGHFAFLIFALGIIGTGLLAVPVLAGSAAYALGEVLDWPIGLERKPKRAKGFYFIIVLVIVIGILLDLLKIDPIHALFWTAVINGIVAAPLMGMIMLIASNKKIMGACTLSKPLRGMGWLTTVVMGLTTIGFFLSHLKAE